MTSTILQAVIVMSASIAFIATLTRLLSLYIVRGKARRLFYGRRLIDAKLHAKLRSDDPVKVEKAMSELRDLVRSDTAVGSEFSSREKKTLKKILSDRASARYFLAI